MGQRLRPPQDAGTIARETGAMPAKDVGAARCASMDFSALAAERLRRARKLPPGPARNELRQIAVALRWLSAHKLSPERELLLQNMLQQETREP
jgi:hypothetical protein